MEVSKPLISNLRQWRTMKGDDGCTDVALADEGRGATDAAATSGSSIDEPRQEVTPGGWRLGIGWGRWRRANEGWHWDWRMAGRRGTTALLFVREGRR